MCFAEGTLFRGEKDPAMSADIARRVGHLREDRG